MDVFVTGHTHQSYVSIIDGRFVTQADWQGKFLTDIDLVISKETGDVLLARAKNVAVTRDVPKDEDGRCHCFQAFSPVSPGQMDRIVVTG